jgi:gamma-glutamyl hercynylcysteine S-oxide synthase
MHTEGIAARSAGKAYLERALIDAREYTLSVLANLTPEQWQVPHHPGINPPRWEFAHIAWFTEWWVLREAHWNARDELVTPLPSLLADADQWFDSGRIAHADRWTLDYPPLPELRDYARMVLEAVLARLSSSDDSTLYPFRLALLHEDMHAEALIYMHQTLDYPPPFTLKVPALSTANDDVEIPAGVFVHGSRRDDSFVFDNEKWASEITLPATRISRQCVSNAAYAEFVEADGYREPRWWSDEGRAWLDETRHAQPARWRKAGRIWMHRWFGRWEALPLDRPVCHVNAFEAEAYCQWARRRLPTEAEWERAATLDIIDWGGAIWEWMANAFAPYPGFAPDAYRDYSQPWFHTHRSVRGGSFVTRPRMHHPRYRNFYLPHRNDIFAGFRTCARDASGGPAFDDRILRG